MSRLALACVLAALALPVAPASAAQIIVVREPGVSPADVRGGGERVAGLPRLRAEVLHVPAARPDATLTRLADLPGVRSAEPDVRLRALGPDRSAEQWAPTRVRAPSAWGLSTGAGVTVAVVDSGVQAAHEDLAGRIVPGGHDWVDDDADPDDESGHGTHVTTALVGDHDAQGIDGIAPNAGALVLRVLDATGTGELSDIVAAFDYAGSRGVRIVSASLGGTQYSPILDQVIRRYPNTLFVVAAGNEGADNDIVPTYPCNVPARNVICVGASDQADARAAFSNVGRASVDVFAPGVGILAGWHLPPDFVTRSGTSMATPIVSGIAALRLARTPSLSALALKNAVLGGSVRIAGLAGLSVTGARADALLALTAAPRDADGDGIGDAWDDCPSAADPGQADSDGNGVGDACQDGDADGVPDSRDSCPSITAPLSTNGCPDTIDRDRDGVFDLDDGCPLTIGPAALRGCPDRRDRDHDGRVDSRDACPVQRARTRSGCPKPKVRSVRARVARCGSRRCLKARIVVRHKASLTIRAQRCRRLAGRCDWKTVLTVRRRARAVTVTLQVPLRTGRYRVRAIARNAEGRSRPRSDALVVP